MSCTSEYGYCVDVVYPSMIQTTRPSTTDAYGAESSVRYGATFCTFDGVAIVEDLRTVDDRAGEEHLDVLELERG